MYIIMRFISSFNNRIRIQYFYNHLFKHYLNS